MNKKLRIISLLFLVGMPMYQQAMTPKEIVPKKQGPDPEILLVIDEKNKYKVPLSRVKESVTLANFIKDLGRDAEINLPAAFNPQAMALIAKSMRSYGDLEGKARLDAIEKILDPTILIDNIFNFLEIADYLEYPMGIKLATRAIASNPDKTMDVTTENGKLEKKSLLQIIIDKIEWRELSHSVITEFARYYFLKNGTDLVIRRNPEMPTEGVLPIPYDLSIHDYLEYRPDDILIEYKGKIRILDLSELNLTSLDGLAEIYNIEQIHKLYLMNNRLSILPAASFNSCPRLKNLFLDYNQLRELPAEIFNPLTRLNELSLSNNHLTTLPASILQKLIHLQSLDINDNKLINLPASLFDTLTQLKGLWLMHNKTLNELPPALFRNTTSLKKLAILDTGLSQENIKALKEALPHTKID